MNKAETGARRLWEWRAHRHALQEADVEAQLLCTRRRQAGVSFASPVRGGSGRGTHIPLDRRPLDADEGQGDSGLPLLRRLRSAERA